MILFAIHVKKKLVRQWSKMKNYVLIVEIVGFHVS